MTNSWPWSVYIRFKNNSTLIAGGVLISNEHVLTSASFMNKANGYFSNLLIYIGRTNILNQTNPSSYSIIKLFKHPFFSSSSYENDLAIIQISPKVVFSDSIRPICLPTSNVVNIIINKSVAFVGW